MVLRIPLTLPYLINWEMDKKKHFQKIILKLKISYEIDNGFAKR